MPTGLTPYRKIAIDKKASVPIGCCFSYKRTAR